MTTVDDYLTDVEIADPPLGHPRIAHSELGICALCEGESESTELKAWRHKAERGRRIAGAAAIANPDDDAPHFVMGAYELSKIIGLKASTLMAWAKAGIIPHSRAPGEKTRYIFDVPAVVAAIDAMRDAG